MRSHPLASALTKANYERDMFNKTAMENSIADDCFRSETKMMVVERGKGGQLA
jgi:hypothetical protein